MSLLSIPSALQVVLLVGESEKGPVTANALVARDETEVLISDKLAGALGIAIEEPGEGLWRLREEPLDKTRKSVPPEEW